MNTPPPPSAIENDVRIVVVDEPDPPIEHYPEDWLAFALFWAVAVIVFVQFFTRYILNDSLAWTEEIARYGLMWIAFLGAAIVVRKNAHIAVEVLHHFLPKPIVRYLIAAIDVIKLFFYAVLFYFSIEITDRMGIQRMTVFDVSMSVVYAGIAFGCFVMLAREMQNFWRNARSGWRDAGGQTMIID